MFSKAGLTFGLIIALFVPGCVFFLALVANLYGFNNLLKPNIESLKNITPLLKDLSLFIIPIAILVSLMLGLVLDSIRYVIVWVIQWLVKSHIDTSVFGEDDRKYHDWVIENNFRFHQFYANFGLSLLISTFLVRDVAASSLLWIFFSLGIVSCVAAGFAYRTTFKNIIQRAQSIKQGGIK